MYSSTSRVNQRVMANILPTRRQGRESFEPDCVSVSFHSLLVLGSRSLCLSSHHDQSCDLCRTTHHTRSLTHTYIHTFDSFSRLTHQLSVITSRTFLEGQDKRGQLVRANKNCACDVSSSVFASNWVRLTSLLISCIDLCGSDRLVSLLLRD